MTSNKNQNSVRKVVKRENWGRMSSYKVIQRQKKISLYKTKTS